MNQLFLHFTFIQNFAIGCLFLQYFFNIYKPKFTSYIYYLALLGISFLGFPFFQTPWEPLCIWISFLFLRKLFEKNTYEILYDFLFITLINFSIEINYYCSECLFNNMSPKTFNEAEITLLRMILTIFLFFLCYDIVIHVFDKKKLGQIISTNLSKTYIIVSFLCNFIILLLTLYIEYSHDFLVSKFLLRVSLIIFIVNILSIYLASIENNNRSLKNNLETIQSLELLTLSQYDILKQKSEYNRSFNHDIKNHLQVIEKANRYQTYRKDIEKHLDQCKQAFYSSNTILEILINNKIQEALKYHIHFQIHYDGCLFSTLSEYDLVSIFSNLLDNAIQATKKCPNKSITMNIGKNHNYTMIQISNPYQTINMQQNSTLKSTKPNHQGVGLSNVQTIVDQNEGHMQIHTENQIFKVTILFEE